MIIPKHITYSPTCLSVETDDISIAIDNGRNNSVVRGCYSAHQAVSKFAEHNIDMVSCVHRKCQTRAGVCHTYIILITLGTAYNISVHFYLTQFENM